MRNFVAIHNRAMPVVEYQGKRVVTFAMIDKAHDRPKGTARQTFNRHRSRFVEGKDFFDVTSSVKHTMWLKDVFPKRTARGLLITERGYLLIVKPFNDSLSWDVQNEMIDSYFRRNTLGELRHVEIPSLEELSQMKPEEAQHLVAKAEKDSYLGHGKPGSAAMTLRRRELKRLRPAIKTVIELSQLSISDLGDFTKGVHHG
ncbi:MAG TPA: ORF6N domain-containing protein [Arsenophonus nasoniae]|uniref:ORF6N domain-containing protein n=1 Tax=Arsenophonus nasoniae TaxID=638 RepID=UPI00387923BA